MHRRWTNLVREIIFITTSLFVFSQGECFGVESGTWSQQPAEPTRNSPSAVIVQVEDYVLTAKDLELVIKSYPAGSISSRESKLRLVENLISTKLFAFAARTAKLDLADDWKNAKDRARTEALIHAYFQRYVQPKFSKGEVQKYFVAHKPQSPRLTYGRSEDLLKDQVLTETNQSLMQQWSVKQQIDLLRDLDLQNERDSSIILARIGDGVFTLGDLREFATHLPPQDLSSWEVKKELLEVAVLERLYALAAEKAGLLNDPEVRKALVSSEDQVSASRYIRSVEEKIGLVEVERYYKKHADEFKRPDQIRLRQIVVATQEQAKAVKTRLDHGESFEEVARSVSTDRASAAQGGEIGWVRPGRLYPEVESVAFQLKPMQISEAIKAPDGYYVLRLEERLEGTARPIDEVAPNLLDQLKKRAIDDERRRLMALYRVTIRQDLL